MNDPCPKCGGDRTNGHLVECKPSKAVLIPYDAELSGGIYITYSKGDPFNMKIFLTDTLKGALFLVTLLGFAAGFLWLLLLHTWVFAILLFIVGSIVIGKEV